MSNDHSSKQNHQKVTEVSILQKTNAFGITKVSCQLFKRDIDKDDNVVAEMQAQNKTCPTQQEIDNYKATLKEMLHDLKEDSKNAYKRACLLTAQRICERKDPAKKVSITSWNQIGLDFMSKPTWENARDLFHILY